MKKGFSKTKEGSSFIKLIMWFIFMGIILISFAFQNKNTPQVKTEEKTFKSLEEMEEDLLNKSMNYKYLVNEDGNITIYNGMRCNNVDTWYKEDINGITKYVKEDKVYKVLLDSKEEYTEEIKTLNDLFLYLKDYNYSENISDETREINYNLGEIYVNIKTNLDNITEINVQDNNVRVEMQFTNIGICDNINLEK